MAISNFQIPNKITFYPSYLQYAYAMGFVEDVESNNSDITKEELYKMISLDPSVISEFAFNNGDWVRVKFNTGTLSSEDDPAAWNFDFGMFLGHNQKQSNSVFTPIDFDDNLTDAYTEIEGQSGIVNYNNGDVPAFNGWSAMDLTSSMASGGIGFMQSQPDEDIAGLTKLGCFVVGKKWEAPQNIDVSNSYALNWGIKQKKTTSGKIISNINYYKANKWLLDAWELSEELEDTRNIATESRNGIRTWKVKWSFLQEKYVHNQNFMQNDNNWVQDEDGNYSVEGADSNSVYDSKFGVDFTTSVLRLTLGNHLPIIINISDSKNSDQWAIVRIKRHSIKQKNPKLIDISLTLEEQI